LRGTETKRKKKKKEMGLTHDVRFLHAIYLTIHEYNMIVSTETSVYHMHFNDNNHLKCLDLTYLFV